MGCGASSLTRVEDYVPADNVSAGCISHVSDQHLDDADIASLVSEPSSAGEEATERPSLLKMKLAARVLHARVRYGINDNPNQFDEGPEKGPLMSRKQYASVAQFIDDHVQSIVRLELEEDTVASASFDETNSSPGMSASTSFLSLPSSVTPSILPLEGEAVGRVLQATDSDFAPKPIRHHCHSTHFHLPLATLRGHLDYDLLSMAAEREGTNTLPLGRFLKHKRRAIRQLSEVLAQRERCNPALASQLRFASAQPQLPVPHPEPVMMKTHLTEGLILTAREAMKYTEVTHLNDWCDWHIGRRMSLRLSWVVGGKSNRQQCEERCMAAVMRLTKPHR